VDARAWVYACWKIGLRSTTGQPMPGRSPQLSVAEAGVLHDQLGARRHAIAGVVRDEVREVVTRDRAGDVRAVALRVPLGARDAPAHSVAVRKSTASTLRWAASITVPLLHALVGGRARAVSRK